MLKINRPRVAKGDIKARVVCRVKQNPRKVIAIQTRTYTSCDVAATDRGTVSRAIPEGRSHFCNVE